MVNQPTMLWNHPLISQQPTMIKFSTSRDTIKKQLTAVLWNPFIFLVTEYCYCIFYNLKPAHTNSVRSNRIRKNIFPQLSFKLPGHMAKHDMSFELFDDLWLFRDVHNMQHYFFIQISPILEFFVHWKITSFFHN